MEESFDIVVEVPVAENNAALLLEEVEENVVLF